jgi:RNA polymerase sigma-70 factor (ECF subfamily)
MNIQTQSSDSPSPALIAAAQAGDAAAFEAIFTAYYPRIVRYCYRLVGDLDTAQDLAQDTFIRAYRALPRTQPGLNIRSWLLTIATNTTRTALRRSRQVVWLPLQEGHPAPEDGEHTAEAIADRALMQAALRDLPGDQATLLLLRLHYGFSYEELAPQFGGSPGAAKTRVSRARRAFGIAYQAARTASAPPAEIR